MVVGTLCLVQKGQTSGCSGILVYGGGALSLVQKGQICVHSKQWTQYTVDAVDAVDAVGSGHSGCSRHSEIAVYCSGDFVFGAKTSNQWTQWMQWNSGIWWWGHCLWYKKVKPVDVVGSGHSGCSRHSEIVVYCSGDIVFGAKTSNQWTQWMQWNSGIWWWGHCLWYKKVKPVDVMDIVE